MSSDCELEVDCHEFEEQQEVIEDINALVDEDFDGSDGEVVDDDEDEQLVIQEEVVVNDDNHLVDEDIDEDIDDNDESVNDNNSPNNDINEDMSNEDNSRFDNDINNDINDDNNESTEEVVKKDSDLAEEKVGENEVYQWSAFTGLRVKTFTAEELAQFRKPFELGWKREVVLRGTVTSSGKKIGDVYYFSPDKKTKLRSYVEMGLFLKRSNSGLQPENFTFARQPIFRPPAEIVRHAMQRGGGQHQLQPSQIIDSSPFTPAKAIDTSAERSARNSTASESEEQFSMSIAEGRAKRKRVAPSRFEDEDYSESSPFKKKSKDKGGSGNGNGQQPSPLVGGKPSMSAGKQIPLQPKTQMSLQEKRRQLQHQLLQQVHEQSLKTQKQHQDKQQLQQQLQQQQQQFVASQMTPNGETSNNTSNNNNNNMNTNAEESIAITKIDANGKQIIMPLSARKSISSSSSAKPKIENEDNKSSTVNNDVSDKSETEGAAQDSQSGAPCSMTCPGRRGMLPNLMCSRCFCLYHLDCVPGGVFLEEPRVFVCPNCLKPEDTQKAKPESKLNSQTVISNGIDASVMNQDLGSNISQSKSLFVSSAPIIIQQPLVKPRSTFAPILPKPPQLQQQQIYQQQQLFQKKKFVPSLPAQPASGFPAAAMNVKLPEGTHLYRVATGPNGHSMIVKNKAFKPKMLKNARKTIAPHISSVMTTSTPSHPLPYYKPAPIAPIAPIKITPKQFHQQLQAILHPSRKRRGYKEWMEKKRIAIRSLVSPYYCLNQVLSYLSVADLVRLRQVSIDWHHLSSQPFLWREIKLKGVHINDWQYLARNIIEINASVGLDFDNIRHNAQNNTDLCDLWRNFATIVDYLKSVKKLKFGSIPTFVLEEVVNAAVTENPYNSFNNLELISVKNVFEEESDIKECRLAFLDQFQSLTQLKALHLNCKNGFIADNNTVELLSNTFSAMNLQSLVLTSLKDFSSEQFVFLKCLKSVKHLEIGSCLNWFQSESDNESETPKQDNELASNVPKTQLKGAFKYLSELSGLQSLRLIDIIIDDCSTYLPIMLESLITLESLTIDNLKIEPSGMEILDHFCAVLKSLPLHLFSISTDDSNTNKCVFDLLKKLDNCNKLLWKVGALVEDSGECFVPFKKEDDNPEDADIENENGDEFNTDSDELNEVKYMDLTFLNEILQSDLANTIIEIIPQ